VGNTGCWKGAWRLASVHPHARGEHPVPEPSDACSIGSSPRPWGTLLRRRDEGNVDRFIPTPVGNTSHERLDPPLLPVHPHARGEHVGIVESFCGRLGSSPRPWGTPAVHDSISLPNRFIPTPVGNTAAYMAKLSVTSVHPHARGEHWVDLASTVADVGSSPRPWGTPVQGLR